MEGRAFLHRRPGVVARPVEPEQQHVKPGRHGPALGQQAIDEARVCLAARFVGAGRVDVERLLDVPARLPDVLHAGVEPEPAARVAVAEGVAMGVPDLGRVDPAPRRLHQRMVSQVCRQFGLAGVEHAVAQREIAACQQQAGRCASTQEAAPVHAGQWVVRTVWGRASHVKLRATTAVGCRWTSRERGRRYAAPAPRFAGSWQCCRRHNARQSARRRSGFAERPGCRRRRHRPRR